MFCPKLFSNCHQSLHGMIGIYQNAGTEEKSFDVISAVKFDGQVSYLIGSKRSARYVVAPPVDAIGTVVNTVIAEHDFQQRYAATIFGKTMANAPR